MIERVAREIAKANGDEFANAFKNKSRWIARRGMSGGRFRDVNEPFQSDYIDMACAALAAMRDTFENVQAGYDIASERGGSADAAIAASNLQTAIDLIDSALSERREKGNG